METKIFKSINLIRRGSGAKLNLFRYAAMVVMLLMLGAGDAWGTNNYYASLKINQSGPTGAGAVYVANSNSKPGTANPGTAVPSVATESSGGNVTMYWWVEINPGYNVSLTGKVTGGPYSAASANGNVSCAASTSADGTQAYTATATFVAVTVDKVNNSTSNETTNLNPTDPSADYPFTVTFATSNLKTIALDLNKSPETADGKFTITSWAQDGNNVVATGKFNGGDSYGGASRNHTTTVSLQSKASGSAAKTCTVTANFPALAFVGVEAKDVYATQGESGKTGSATFTYNYGAEDDFPTAPTLTPVSGTGVLAITGYTVTPSFSGGTCEVTVDYTYDTNNGVGDTEATLTLTAANGDARSVTIAGHSEAAATDDAKVIAADGETLIYQGDWATAWSKANLAANAGCTISMLRDVNVAGNQTVTNTFTFDLNGKTMHGVYNGSIIYVNTAGKTITIKDSKTGGKIENISERNGVVYLANIEKGNLVLESGTLYAKNTAVFNHSTLASLGTRAVNMSANTTFTMNGGTIEAVGGRNVYGIYQVSSSDNNTADKSVVTIKGGTIKAEAPAYVYGVMSYGKVKMSAGTIDVTVNTETVNSNASYVAANFNDYTLHRYAYGIRMYATSSATLASNYFGTLTITGGAINVTNLNKTMNGTTLYNEHIYGVKMENSVTGAGAGKTAPDGTKVMKACAIGSIENATITLTHTGVLGYGVMANGCYNSVDNQTTPFQIKNSTINVTTFQTAYGIYADAYVNWSSTLTALTGNGGCTYGNFELTNTTINATTTGGSGAYCGRALCTSGTVAKAKETTGSTSTGNATYYGEYSAAGKIVVNSGTYTASAATSSAYGFMTDVRAKCVRNVNGVFSGRDAATDPQGSLSDNTPTSEAYPELYIHGGEISATTGTSTTAIAVQSGGNTVIDGGTFNAYSGASTAYGLYVPAGKTVANGVTFPASATTKAYGVYVTGAVSDWSLFTYFGEVELNNCNASGTARTTTDARGVFVEGNTKVYTQASFDAMKSANNSNYQNNGDYAQVGERAFVGKATINGGTYTATAETTTAYGIIVNSTRVSTNKEAIAYNPLVVRNATVTAKTNTGTTAYGVQLGGGGLVENCTITATAGTTTASGVRAIDKTTVIKNSTISAKGTDAVYGLEGYVSIDATHGYCWHGEYDLTEAGNTKVTAESTGSSKPAYAIYLKATKRNIASGNFAGDYVIASDATISEGTYIAKINGGTSGYALALDAQQIQGSVVGQSEVLINGGKFNGATAEVGTAGVVDHVQLKGGYYVHNTNLSKYIPEGYEEFPLPDDRPEYTEGYRYGIEPVGNHGIYVCQIGSTKYKTLEEALQAVTSGKVIYMIANYTMTTPGDYILPSGATLLIPYKTGSGAGATTAIGNSAKTTTSATTPTLFRKLTFGPGVNLICSGTIETSAEQKANGQYGANVGMASGAYGQIHLEEGSHISIESGARLNCWGFITGKGTIEVKNGGKILEGFQMGDWCGGTNYNNVFKSASTANYVFPITHYFYQSIECPITYRPGCRAYGSTHVNVTFAGTVGQDDVPLVGTSGSMFIMDDNDVSKETWVMKDYDEETDQCIWTINSGASIGNLTISISGYNMKSASYDLPITTNMSIVLNYGEMAIGQNTVMLPGSKLIVNKQGTAVINGVAVVAYDAEDWTGSSRYFATYSPTWGTSSPRKNIPVADAEMFLHGKVNIKGNGGLYTTPSGANIHSTNEDAGEVIYTTAATGNKTSYYLNQGGTTRPSLTVNPARLKNGDDSYEPSAGTAAGKTWTYKNDVWDAWSKDGCFLVDAQDKLHAKPAELVELTSKTPDVNYLHHDAATGARNFVWDKDCYWWEVVTTPTPEGYYQSLNPDNNGKYNYYYYDSAADCWKIKTITVTWSINGNNTDYSVGYGTKPHWLGATPTKTSSSSDYAWRWDGWTLGSDPTVYENEELPVVTANTTFTAHFYEKYYQSLVTFKNSDGTILDSKLWNRGSIPFYEGTPTKDATASQTFEFNGSWIPAITAVGSSSVEYIAQYTPTTRQYNVEFVNYDMSPLGSILVDYDATPTTATYKAAIAPSDFEPYKPDNSAYSFVFDDWRLNGASSNGFVQVKGDQTYVAQYEETTKKYRIEFVDNDGETLLHWTQLEYGAMAAYDGPATSGFDKQEVEWNYTFTGWTPATFSEVQSPQTYTAVYDKTKRKYDITWKDGNGNTLKTDQVAYGETPAYSGSTPTKTSTNTQNFTFNNTWSPAITAVTGEETYTAQFDATDRKYRVTWDANSGTCGTEYTDFSYNAAIGTLPSASKTGYTFNGWFTSATGGTQIATSTKVTADVTYHAQFAPNPYTITFNSNGGSSVASITQNYGTAVTAPADPIREGYTFKGWSPAVPNTMPLNGTTCVAQWTINQYTITFDSKGGSDVASITQNYGTAVTAPADPTREGYTFNGWNPDVPKTMPANGAACIAQWTANPHTPYTVKHYKQKLDGSYAATPDETDYLDGPTDASVTPARKNYAGFTAPAGQTVTILANGSLVVTYQYTRNSYNLSWSSNGGNELTGNYTTGSVKYGASITAPNDPTRTGYSFSGWSPAYTGTMPATNTEYQAQWTPEKRTVTWKDGTTTIKTEEWNYDSKPSFNYVKTPTAQYSFPLLKWEDEATGTQYDPDNLPLINADVTYKAIYGNVTNKYTIRFVNDGGTELQVINDIPYGEKPVYTEETPASEIHDYYIREFKGWSPEIVEVEGHTTYTARYEIVAKLEIKEEYVVPTTTIVETTTVEVGGSLNVASEEKLTTTDLIIESSADEDWNEVTSGEVVAVESAISADNAYYDMKPAGGYKARIWYAVAVPWTVDVPTGVAGHVYDANGRALRLDIDFDLLYYDGAQRAAGGTNNWRYVAQEEAENQVMKPGKAYMIYLASPTSKLRFEKSSGKWLTKELSLEYYPLSTGDDADANWNGIANPAIYRAYLNAGTDGNWGQVFVPGSAPRDGGTYAPVDMSTYKLAVGQPIFVQAENTEKETVVAYQSNTDYTNHAPRRAQADAAEQEARYAVEIAVNGKRGDRIFIATDEDKEDVYTIGRDVVKMGLSNTKPQMWINRYDSKLCVNTIEFNGTTAVYPLTIQIPTEGEYSLYTPSDILTGHELYLTYNGRSIWNLRYAPYVDTFTAGTHAEYGLKLVRSNMPTDIDQTGAEQKNVRKMIVDDHVYIIRGNNVYTVDGQLVK